MDIIEQAANERQDPPLTEEERVALQAAEVAAGDWGFVFVYGMFLSGEAWSALIGRVPEMRAAKVRGYERREIRCSASAALAEVPKGLVVGMTVAGLKPSERRLLDAAVDEGFYLTDISVRHLDEPDLEVECTTYMWREEFMQAVGGDDWDQTQFQDEHLSDFVCVCADLQSQHAAMKFSDEELREQVMQRRRRKDGFDDEPEWKAPEDALSS